MKKKICLGILVFLLPFIVFLGSFKLVVFDNDFYSDEFVKNNVDVDDKEKISTDLIYFLKTKKADASFIDPFSSVEQEHLFEVRDVMHVFFSIFNLCVFFFVAGLYYIYFLDKKKFFFNLGKGLFYGGIAGGVVGIVFLLFAFFFDKAFTIFHQLFFRTQWQFPADYLLVTLFPQQFFIDAFFRIIVISLIGIVVLGVVGYLIKRKN